MTVTLTPEGAAAALRGGEVVALPTDTVYGVGASIESAQGVAALFELKRRPLDSALPVVAASREAVRDLVVAWPHGAERLSRLFWPGALTVVVEASAELCARVGSHTGRVGFRIPDDPALIEVLRLSGPLALTSANDHGAAPCVTAEEVATAFAGRHELSGVLDAGRRGGAVSTVVEFVGDTWRVVRDGAISREQVNAALE